MPVRPTSPWSAKESITSDGRKAPSPTSPLPATSTSVKGRLNMLSKLRTQMPSMEAAATKDDDVEGGRPANNKDANNKGVDRPKSYNSKASKPMGAMVGPDGKIKSLSSHSGAERVSNGVGTTDGMDNSSLSLHPLSTHSSPPARLVAADRISPKLQSGQQVQSIRSIFET